MENKKTEQKLRNELLSPDPEKVFFALGRIREVGNREILPALFDLLASNPAKEVENEVEAVLSTVKDKNTVALFAEALGNPKYKSITKILLVACWQNGLDFSPFLPVFVDLVIAEEWEIAFEAFTVIENMEFLPGDKIISEAEAKINRALPTATGQKEYFLKEILAHIR